MISRNRTYLHLQELDGDNIERHRFLNLPRLTYVPFSDYEVSISRPTSPGEATMPGFMDLSREIRDMIYTLALVVDDVIIPYHEFYPLSAKELSFRKNMPCIGLLGVSKVVEAEAAEVLFGKNTWRITSNFQGAARKRIWKDTIFVRRAPLFRHVILVFNQGDVDPYEYRCLTQNIYEDYESEDEDFQDRDADIKKDMHESAVDIMGDSWTFRVGCFVKMSNLVSVKLDVYWLYCHTGCCRRSVLDLLLVGIKALVHKKGFAAREMLVTGLRNSKENNRAQDFGFTTDFVEWDYD